MSVFCNLRALEGTIRSIMSEAGTPGLRLCVLSGEDMYERSFNAGHPSSPSRLLTSKTIFACCSLSKAATAAALARYIGADFTNSNGQQAVFRWDTPVQLLVPELYDYLRRMGPPDQVISHFKQLTLHHLLTHTSGLARGDLQWYGEGNQVRLTDDDFLGFMASRFNEFESPGVEFAYNNDGWMLAGQVLVNISGWVRQAAGQMPYETFDDIVASEVLEPLDMRRTFFAEVPADEGDVAEAYSALHDTTPFNTGHMTAGNHPHEKEVMGFAAASSGMKSCEEDLIKFYRAWIRAYNDQKGREARETSNNPLKHVPDMMEGHQHMATINGGSDEKSSYYGYGWVRVQLPGPMGLVGCNIGKCQLPEIGEEMPAGLPNIWYHQGSFVGSLACVVLVPARDMVILVLSNCLALCDTADFVAQMAVRALLTDEPPADIGNAYMQLAQDMAAESSTWSAGNEEQMNKLRGTEKQHPKHELAAYEGTYWLSPYGKKLDPPVFKIVVRSEKGRLFARFSGASREEKHEFKLSLWNAERDQWRWTTESDTRNCLARGGFWPELLPRHQLIRFEEEEEEDDEKDKEKEKEKEKDPPGAAPRAKLCLWWDHHVLLKKEAMYRKDD